MSGIIGKREQLGKKGTKKNKIQNINILDALSMPGWPKIVKHNQNLEIFLYI